ncbi:MAG TPA: alpha/beta hydrolase [Ktedonobacteraceae bacterium]|nr:alpha/beta hydrolase [Ktedonobacteraceae bacterium]
MSTSKHLVDPEILPLLDLLPGLDLSAETLAQTRIALKELVFPIPEFPNVVVSERKIMGPQDAPDVRILLYTPKNITEAVPALLWIHGGGYVIGTAEQSDLQLKTIVSSLNCVAVAVDYRLAPETPHPGPVEDCYAALKWLHANANDLGVDSKRIAIGGDSAGGGLAAGLGLLNRDRGEVPLIYQLLIYPMLDDRTVTSADPHPYAGEYVWRPGANRFGWASLLGQEPGSPGVSPYASAARAENLEGLPPTFIGVGTLDLFLEEDMEYARRLIRAGVPTELHVYPGAFHAFPMVESAKVSQAHNRDYLSALGRAFHKS